MTTWKQMKENVDVASGLLRLCWRYGSMASKLKAPEALIVRPLHSLVTTALVEFEAEPAMMGASVADTWEERFDELCQAFRLVQWESGRLIAGACLNALSVAHYHAVELTGAEVSPFVAKPHVRLGHLFTIAVEVGAPPKHVRDWVDMHPDVAVHTAT